MTDIAIMHHPDEQCFVLAWQGEQARLDYQWLTATQVDFNHTYVPAEFRGQGLAGQLVQAGLNWASQQQLQVHASCWYVAKVIRLNGAKAAP